MAWGSPEEQLKEQEAGNLHVKDWHDEALKVVEKTMAEYWVMPTRTSAAISPPHKMRQPEAKGPRTNTHEL